MRFGWVVAAAAMLGAAPISAATIVQTDNESFSLGFDPFDSARGRLTSATLSIEVQKSRLWQLEAPLPLGSTKAVSWTVDGTWFLRKEYTGAASDLFLPITGTGTSNVVLDRSVDGASAGYFDVSSTGATTVNVDTAKVTGSSRFFFNGTDLGYFDGTGADTSFSIAGANRLTRLSGACYASGGVPFAPGEDICGSVRYTLTYNYDSSAAVPEPSTWAMMVLGFGALGYLSRRRTRPLRRTLARRRMMPS